MSYIHDTLHLFPEVSANLMGDTFVKPSVNLQANFQITLTTLVLEQGVRSVDCAIFSHSFCYYVNHIALLLLQHDLLKLDLEYEAKNKFQSLRSPSHLDCSKERAIYGEVWQDKGQYLQYT